MSPSATDVNPEFEAAAARVLADAPETESGFTPVAEPIPVQPVALVSAETVGKYIQLPFKALATWAKEPGLELVDYEADLFTQPVTDCINKYVPDWLKQTDRPELVMLATAICVYLMRIGQTEWAQKLLGKKRSSEQGTVMPDSAALSAS